MDSQFKIEMSNRPGVFTLVDEDTYQWAHKFKWHLDKYGYAQRSVRIEPNSKRFTKKFIHRFIMNPPRGLVIDHINHNKLDNRRSNLRICTVAENNLNINPFKRLGKRAGGRAKTGPSNVPGKIGLRQTRNGNWGAYFYYYHKQIYVGTFLTREVAEKECEIRQAAFYQNLNKAAS